MDVSNLLILLMVLFWFFVFVGIFISYQFPEHKLLNWGRAFLIVFAVCFSDEILGRLYLKFLLIPKHGGAINSLTTQSVVFFDNTLLLNQKGRVYFDKYRQAVRYFLGKSKDGRAFFPKVQIVASENSDGKPIDIFEIGFQTDEKNPNCSSLLTESNPIALVKLNYDEEKQFSFVASFVSKEDSACLELKRVPKITSNYLVSSRYKKVSMVEDFLGIDSVLIKSVMHINSGEIVSECNVIQFSGGWVSKYIFLNTNRFPLFTREYSNSVCNTY